MFQRILSNTLLSIILFIKVTSGIFYQGVCPEPDSIEKFSCEWSSKSYVVLVNLPASNHTVNFFHNPFEKPDCLLYRITCGTYRIYSMSFMVGCLNETKNSKFCYPLNINRTEISSNFEVNFDFIPTVKCDARKIWNKFYLLHYIKDILYVFWGCRLISKDMNEQGMLVLLNENFNSAENRAFYMANVLENVDEKFIHKNDLDHNYFNRANCACKNCDYSMKCETAPGLNMIDVPLTQSENVDFSPLKLIFMLMVVALIAIIALKFISNQD